MNAVAGTGTGERKKGRLILVSNRLPFTISTARGQAVFQPSAGGVVTGLRSFLDRRQEGGGPASGCLWVGWPGNTIPPGLKTEVCRNALAEHGSLPIFLTNREMERFYHGFCNKTIWPLFHYFPSYMQYIPSMWEEYRRVNERFAEVIAPETGPDDEIWVHDYHLMLLPAILRAKLPGRQIGFFLHIPFPSFEIFRLLPARWRREILEGILGADLVGFHTYEYTQHFLQCVLRIADHTHHLGTISTADHIVRVQTFPLGIDFDRFHDGARSEEAVAGGLALRASLGTAKVILSLDRLDYTKGILNRLEAFELLLERHRQYHRGVVLLLTVVPSRVALDRYEKMKRQIEEAVGKINGRFGEVGWTPVIYQYRNLAFATLVAHYAASDIALITPLRDGMNLIAKEYVASRHSGNGVLILSEMAGAVKELGEAIVINPNDIGEIAEAIHEALTMPVPEQFRRITAMQVRLRRYTVERWAGDFLGQLGEMEAVQSRYLAKLLGREIRSGLLIEYARTTNRIFLLDYDGTLVPFHDRPRMAMPPEDVIGVLKRLCADTRNTVAIVSGRDRRTLDDFFGTTPLLLVAEHGAWVRDADRQWRTTDKGSSPWMADLLPVLELYTDRLPGSFVEAKESGLAWHFRRADPEQRQVLAGELVDYLTSFTANIDVQIMQGNKVIEIRNSRINKGSAVAMLLAKSSFDFILSVGDDWTDEDIFRMLPPEAHSVKVGMSGTHAKYNLRNREEVGDLLRAFAEVRP